MRYFKPIGAHQNRFIREDPRCVSNNLIPYIAQVASGRREKLQVFGNDYKTEGGSCVRDYIHVMYLAEDHLAVIKYCQNNIGLVTVNLGTGKKLRCYDLLRHLRMPQAKIFRMKLLIETRRYSRMLG